MCSRFELTARPEQVAARFGLAAIPPLPRRPAVHPTDAALALRWGGQASLPGWGLVVPWDKAPLINARAESLASRPTFRTLDRVLIPATGWWEWPGEGRLRRKVKVTLPEQEPFALAGLSDGRRFVIVTCAPGPALAGLHDRMPVILPRDGEARWLDPALSLTAVAPVLAPFGGAVAITDDAPPPAQGELFAP